MSNRLRNTAPRGEFDAFERLFARLAAAFGAIWVAVALVSVTFVGVVIWGIVSLVQHYT